MLSYFFYFSLDDLYINYTLCHFCLERIAKNNDLVLIKIKILLLQPKNKMVQQYVPIAWAPARAHRPLSELSQSFLRLVDCSNHGNGNGKKSLKNSKQLLEVSLNTVPILFACNYRNILNMINLWRLSFHFHTT